MVLSGPRPLAFWVLSDALTPHPERRFGIHGLERASTIGILGLERRLDPSSRTVVRLHGLERRLDPSSEW
ncbi:unnamed protein product [Musa textilis]